MTAWRYTKKCHQTARVMLLGIHISMSILILEIRDFCQILKLESLLPEQELKEKQELRQKQNQLCVKL